MSLLSVCLQKEELAVAVATARWGCRTSRHRRPQRRARIAQALLDHRVQRLVAHDAALADLAGCSSNCGLASISKWPPARTSGASAGSTSVSEMNDRSPVTRSKSAGADLLRASARAHSASRWPPRARRRAPWVQLAVADVDAHHLRGAVLQQAVGEAAGGLADVEAVQPVTSRPPRATRLPASARRARRSGLRPCRQFERVGRQLVAVLGDGFQPRASSQRTPPAISRCACERDRVRRGAGRHARPRSTRSWSARIRRRSVAVRVGLVRARLAHADVRGLLVGQLGQLRASFFSCRRATFSSRCLGST
jgi:hypothetical protein